MTEEKLKKTLRGREEAVKEAKERKQRLQKHQEIRGGSNSVVRGSE